MITKHKRRVSNEKRGVCCFLQMLHTKLMRRFIYTKKISRYETEKQHQSSGIDRI